MKTKISLFLVILLCILVAVAIDGTIYLVLANARNQETQILNNHINRLENQVQKLQAEVKAEVKTVPEIISNTADVVTVATTECVPAETSETTTNWETYTDKDIGISFKYPKGYSITPGNWNGLFWNISNCPSNISIDNKPSDYINMKLSYDSPSEVMTSEFDLVTQLPTVKKQTAKTADDSFIIYYKYYSNLATDYTTQPAPDRTAQILAYTTLSNKKTFTATIGNYDWIPQNMDQKQVDFIIRVFQTIRAV